MADRPSTRRTGSLPNKLRKLFIIKAYLVFVVFVLLSVLQWFLLSFETISTFIHSHIELCITCLFVALVMMIILVFVENVRFTSPLNWLLTLIILECLLVALGPIMTVTCMDVFFLSAAAALLSVLICAIIGSFIPHDFTLDVIVLFVLSFIFFIGALYFVILHAISGFDFSMYVFCGLICFILCIFVMYHAQTINGNRYAEMRLTDYLLAALILYVDFLVFYMLATFVFANVWQNMYDIKCNKRGILVEG